MNTLEDNQQESVEQKPPNKHNRLWLAIALAVAGAALFVGSFYLPGASSIPGIIVPSPTWAAFPTRAVVIPKPSGEAMATYHLRIALLSEDVEDAQKYWEERLDMDELDAVEWYLGATLALQQDDPDMAANCVLKAIEKDSTNAQYWQALALIYRRADNNEAAAQCLSIAETYSADATAPLDNFDERWRTALQAQDKATLLDLALLHNQEQPESSLDAYYASKALLLSHEYTLTIDALIDVITPTGKAHALLWYTLGEAYYAVGGYNEAITVFEVALTQYSRGDNSLEIAMADPLVDLNWYLAQAYFYAGECAKAELVFTRWEETRIDARTWISRAVICQTPTPTPTPWILSQQSTATPTP